MDSGARKRQVLAQLTLIQPASAKQIGYEIGVGKAQTHNHLVLLEAEGRVKRVGTGANRILVWEVV